MVTVCLSVCLTVVSFCVCSDVNLYIPNVPEGIKARELEIVIDTTNVSVRVGRQSSEAHPAYYLNHEVTKRVKVGESFWTFDSEAREIHIQLAKAQEEEVWGSVFVGHDVSGGSVGEEDRKKLMLERFQAEHPGFDFSGAAFTGNVPDPKTFLRQT